jgi:hypothetical protein
MAIVKVGTLTVATGGAAQNLNLGFVPSYFRMTNQTKIPTFASTAGLVIVEWYNFMPNASANLWTTSSTDGTIKLTYTATNGITPITAASQQGTEFVPTNMTTNTNLTITGISKAAQASITATHPFTSADIGVTTVTFHGINGMTQMNTLSGVVQSVTSTTSFTVNINSTSFSTWTSGGIANVITGQPASETVGFQIFNTPLYNTSIIGLTLGSTLMVTTADVWDYTAFLDASFTSD